MMMKMTTSKNAVLLGLLVLLVVSVECFIPRSHQQKATTTTTRKHQRQQPWMNKISLETRGGASLQDEDSDDSDSDDSSDSEDDEEDVAAEAEEEETDDESDDETDPSSIPLPAVNTAATVVFRTNIGSNLVDISSMELLVSRSRTVESVKQTLSRMLPGRPPVECLAIMADGMVLDDDEILLDSVLDDDDDEEDGEPTVLLLNMIPPVDPKFAAALGSTMQDMSTSELLDSYTANAAAMSASSTTDDTTMISTRIRQDAHDMREQLLSDCGFSASVVESLSSSEAAAATESTARRGQRYRATGGGGARTNLKRIIQTNLNISWPDTIRNFLLFLFFGFFGGRSVISRNLMLLGAPMCFILQARPVKMLLKQLFYMSSHPPGILLSLLPAPQQAILNFKWDESQVALYGETVVVADEEEEAVEA